MATGTAILQPTFTGHVSTTHDALILFEACLTGALSHVPRRPHDRERNSLIRSGCVFIYEENASGIKRWTDGVTWSPSRILGNFLVYRELDKPFPPGEKKRAMKKTNRRPARPGEPYARSDSNGEGYSPTASQASAVGGERAPTEAERLLIGSLIDSYGFKADGLVKKTMSVTVQGVTHHLVSYYNVNDVVNNQLRTPSQTESLQFIRPRPELMTKQSFRAPLEDMDETVEGAREGHLAQYGYRSLGLQGYLPIPGPYYMPGPYPPTLHHHQATTAGYTLGTPAVAGSFMPGHVGQSQIQQREADYGSYVQSPYNRSYDPPSNNMPPISHPKSMPPTPNSALPPSLPDRSQSQSHQQQMYSQQNMQGRNMNAPSSVDSRMGTYNREPYNMSNVGTSPVDPNRQMQPSPILKYEDRRDSPTHASAPMYASDRAPYYVGTSGASVAQGHYQGSVPVSPWQGPTPGHSQI